MDHPLMQGTAHRSGGLWSRLQWKLWVSELRSTTIREDSAVLLSILGVREILLVSRMTSFLDELVILETSFAK